VNFHLLRVEELSAQWFFDFFSRFSGSACPEAKALEYV
jgi:hypothetical protein